MKRAIQLFRRNILVAQFIRTTLPLTHMISVIIVILFHVLVAQGLGRRSLAAEIPDLWLTYDHFVGKVSAMGQPTRPSQPSIPPGSANEQ